MRAFLTSLCWTNFGTLSLSSRACFSSSVSRMGIKDLTKVIGDHSPDSIKLNDIKAYFGRKIAIDASMSLYQFLIAIRQDGAHLTDESGETTRFVGV